MKEKTLIFLTIHSFNSETKNKNRNLLVKTRLLFEVYHDELEIMFLCKNLT